MERDFLGLNLESKGSSEIPSGGTLGRSFSVGQNFALTTGSEVQWPYTMDVSPLQEDKQRHSVANDHFLPYSTFYPLSSAYSSNSTSKLYFPSSSKKTPNMTWRNFPTTSRNAPSTDARTASACGNGSTGTAYPMSLGGILSAMENSAAFFPSAAQEENGKTSEAPTLPLTILYGNAVLVYDEISPQKAEAIMSMAKNASSGTTANNHQHHPSSAATNMRGSAYQARKASLDRFLENRKRRRNSV